MDTIGSAGSLAAAGLATAGQYLQSMVLDLFLIPFGSAIGTLVFLVSVAILFYRVAILGDFRSAGMLLFGALLFGVAIFPRATSHGVKWELGGRDHDDRLVADTLKGIYTFGPLESKLDKTKRDTKLDPDAPPSFEVSWLFAMYDRIVTGIVQSATKVIGVASGKSDLKFLARTSNFQQLFSLGIVDSQMQAFIQSVLFENCAEWIGLYQASIDPTQTGRADQIDMEINKWSGKAVLSTNDAGYEQTKKLYNGGFFGVRTDPLPSQLSCDDLWSLAYGALKAQAYSQSVEVVTDRLPDGITPDEMLLQAAVKFGADDTSQREDVARMMNAIAGRMLIGAFRERYPALTLVDQLPAIRRPPDDGSITESQRYSASTSLKQETLADADFSQGEYFGYIAALPYLQGILLFFLSLSYPVFCLALLNPNRIRGFLLWFGLWFWVKLWDFGFSVVMKVDDLLYYLLPHGPNIDDSTIGDPGAVLRAVLSADPTYSISIYWDVMAMLLASIPIITAMMTWAGGNIVMYQVQSAFTNFAQDKFAPTFRSAGVETRASDAQDKLKRTAAASQSGNSSSAINVTPAAPQIANDKKGST